MYLTYLPLNTISVQLTTIVLNIVVEVKILFRQPSHTALACYYIQLMLKHYCFVEETQHYADGWGGLGVGSVCLDYSVYTTD